MRSGTLFTKAKDFEPLASIEGVFSELLDHAARSAGDCPHHKYGEEQRETEEYLVEENNDED